MCTKARRGTGSPEGAPPSGSRACHGVWKGKVGIGSNLIKSSNVRMIFSWREYKARRCSKDTDGLEQAGRALGDAKILGKSLGEGRKREISA